MKKVIAVLCLVVLCLSAAACGNNADPGNNTEKPVDTSVKQTGTKETTPSSENDGADAVELKGEAYVLGKDIYFNYNTARKKKEERSSLIFFNNDPAVIALVYDSEESVDTPAEALELMNDGRAFNALQLYSVADFVKKESVFEISFDSKQEKKINELNVVGFEGNVVDNNGRSCFVYGYSFVIDETPCMLIGLDSSEEQEQNTHELLTNEVDAMIKTVRAEY